MGSNMTSTKRLATPVSLLATFILATFCINVAAQDAAPPANTVRVGMYFVRYSASAQDLTGPFTPPGLNLRVASVNTPYFAYLRRLDRHWSLELAAGVPPQTHTYGVGPAKVGSVPFDGQEVATAKWFSPSVLMEYNFFPEQAKFRPYVGAGINYTHFYERNGTAAGQAITGGPTVTSLSNSIGPAVTAGLAYNFTRNINAIASFSFARVNSNFDSNTGGIDRTTQVHFNPRTLVIAAGYSF
jgi:outer membrane protein